MTKPLCIYHGNCADGFTAAWAVWKHFHGEVDMHAGVYGAPPPDVTDRSVILVDFSYKRPVLQEMRKRAHSMLVLDHHKTAAEDLAPGGRFVDISKWTPVDVGNWQRHLNNAGHDIIEGAHEVIYVFFDMRKSGALLAWEWFHEGRDAPNLVQYVSDRDLWKFELPLSREISAFIFSHDYTFSNWQYLNAAMKDHMGVQHCADQGGAIERKHHKDIAELVKVCKREMIIGGHWVPAASLPYTLTSDAGHLMCEPYASDNLQGEVVTPPFAACYWDTPKGRVFSLRSRDDGMDVADIAKMYGGGGHKHASGFQVPFSRLSSEGHPIL